MKRFLLLLSICLLTFSVGCSSVENSESNLYTSNATYSDEINSTVSSESKEEAVSKEAETESEIKAETESKTESSKEETASYSSKATDTASKNTKSNGSSKSSKTSNKSNTAANTSNSSTQTVHKNTEVRNKKSATTTSEGYTGDTYCKDCGTKLSSGKTIAMLKLSKETYELPDHSTITVNKGTDLFDYTLDLAHKSANSKYSGVEKEILKLINEERKKAGIGALSWNSKVYYYANKRATECHTCFDHTRPNGKDWYTVFTDANVLLDGELGENLAVVTGVEAKELAAQVVKSWMNSPTHRANILDPAFKSTAISIVSYGDEFCIEECFCG